MPLLPSLEVFATTIQGSPNAGPIEVVEKRGSYQPVCGISGYPQKKYKPYKTIPHPCNQSECSDYCKKSSKCKSFALGKDHCRLYSKAARNNVKSGYGSIYKFYDKTCPCSKPKLPTKGATSKAATTTKASYSTTSVVTISTTISTPTSTTSSLSSTSSTSTTSSSSSSTSSTTTSSTTTSTATSSSSTSSTTPTPTCNSLNFISEKFSEDAYYDYDYTVSPMTYNACRQACLNDPPVNSVNSVKAGVGSCLIFAVTSDYCLKFYQLEGNSYIPQIADADPTTSQYGAYMNDRGCPAEEEEPVTVTATITSTTSTSTASSTSSADPDPEIVTITITPTLITSTTTSTSSSTSSDTTSSSTTSSAPTGPTPTCGISALIGPGYDAVFSYNYDVPPSFATCQLECRTLTNPRASGPCLLFGVPKRDTDGYCLLTYPKAGSSFVPTISGLYATDSLDAALWYDVDCSEPPQ
ncbi:hypothetical protein HII31_13209 [Pseudocercospora fuligena]|uniref:Apple domain-containing protein n=1 Tax=Pseudocercospora fuligena TaxID=685502 RepID=A0A8H6R573_9PEZI|nr:hypothetical protein HII31_13209 [Pseudocercospora fuligena]